jgi:ribosomal protein S12 methylthiotransferase
MKQQKCLDSINKQIFFISLGCSRNLVDTEVMIGILLQKGYEIGSSLEDADRIIINTCGFLEASRQESIQTIQSAIQSKKPEAKVIVTGCMAQVEKERIEKECSGVHFFLGSGDITSLLDAVDSKEPGSFISNERSFLETGDVPRVLSTPKHYAYLKIAEGCRKRCSYCIIPFIKGPLKSKPVDQVLKEMRSLLQQGVKELILIAQDLGDWGKDLGFKDSSGLCHLLKEILKEPGDFRLRLLYLYPDEITEELISLIQKSDKIIPYLDMPIQHINDELLKKMYRATSKEMILSLLSQLRTKIPNITIRTSLIVGFPSETEEQFQELCDFLKEQQLDNVGVFEYSQEEKSASFSFPEQIPDSIKKKRAKKLLSIQKKIVSAKNKKMIGKTIEVVVERYHPDSKYLLVGRHDGQCPEVDGCVIINDARKVDAFGKRYMVAISDAFEYDLVGSVINKMNE